MPIPPAPLPVQRLAVVADTADTVAEAIDQMYAFRERVNARRLGPRPRYHLSTVTGPAGGAGPLSADRNLASGLTLHTVTIPMPELAIITVTSGHIDLRAGRGAGAQQARIKPGQSGLYLPGAPISARCDDMAVCVLRLPWHLAGQIAEEHTGLPAAQMRFLGMRPLPRHAAMWQRTYAHVFRELEAPDSALAHPLIAPQLARILAAAALVAFPNTTMTAARLPGDGRVAPAALRRAVTFIDENAERPLTLTQIAAAAGTSARAIQYAFRRHHDTTPTGYLTRVRLERAHRDLQAADPTTGDTVAAIARRWGFTSLGRFAAAYRTAYGCNPSDTLRT